MRRNQSQSLGIIVLLAAVLAVGMLGLYRTTFAQQRGNPLPFANSVEQRDTMVRELQEIKELLREQNTLLRTLVSNAASKDSTANSAARTPSR